MFDSRLDVFGSDRIVSFQLSLSPTYFVVPGRESLVLRENTEFSVRRGVGHGPGLPAWRSAGSTGLSLKPEVSPAVRSEGENYTG